MINNEMLCEMMNSLLDKIENAEDELEFEKAFREILKLAEQGIPEAQYNVGYLMYMNPDLFGDDANQDAALWFKKASDAGIPEAQRYLGQMYRDGEGVDRNIEEAIRLLSLASEHDLPYAQSALAHIYYFEKYGHVDKAKAYLWYSQAAMHGEGEAQYILGKMYYEGDLVPKNWKLALEFLEPALWKGYADSRRIIEEIKASLKSR